MVDKVRQPENTAVGDYRVSGIRLGSLKNAAVGGLQGFLGQAP